MNIPHEVMTADQVAELLQISRDMVYQLATRGELPGRKLGRIWRFSREAIDEFMGGRVAEPSSSRADARVGATEPEGSGHVELGRQTVDRKAKIVCVASLK